MDKILVVDDELDINNLVKLILEDSGYKVITASNAARAHGWYSCYLLTEVVRTIHISLKSKMQGTHIPKKMKKKKGINQCAKSPQSLNKFYKITKH